jgi:hypothetical protein
MDDKPDLFDLYLLGAPLRIAVGVRRAWDELTLDDRRTWHELTADEQRVVLYTIATRLRSRSAGATLH